MGGGASTQRRSSHYGSQGLPPGDLLPTDVQRSLSVAIDSVSATIATSPNQLASDDVMGRIIQSLQQTRTGLDKEPTQAVGVEFLVTMDPGQDLDDEMLLVLLAALTKRGLLTCRGVVTCLAPAEMRARLAAGTLRSLGLSTVPTAAGTDGGGAGDDASIEQMKRVDYLTRASSIVGGLNDRAGFSLMRKALQAAPDRGIVLVVVSSLKDAAELLREEEDLFKRKVREVVIQGGVQSFEPGVAADGVMLVPDSAHNNEFDSASSAFIYRRCQELGVPLLVISRYAAYGAPVPRGIYDEMAAGGGRIGKHLQTVQCGSIERLWQRACAPDGSAERAGLPSRCDKAWFVETFCGGDGSEREGSDSIWDCVKTFNMYDPLALVAVVPSLAQRFFNYDEFIVNGTSHRVIGVSKERPGIKAGCGLQEWLCAAFKEGAQMELS